MDESLRENLSMGLSDGLDKQIVAGTNGLLTGANLAAHAAAAVTSYADYVSHFAFGRVDGRYANMAADIRIVMGSGTYAHAAGLYRGTGRRSNMRWPVSWLIRRECAFRPTFPPSLATSKTGSFAWAWPATWLRRSGRE